MRTSRHDGRWERLAVSVAISLGLVATAHAQRGEGPPQPPARAAAPIDLTGYWVAEITEDWRWRMVTPAKGDYSSIPLTLASQKIADAWDPARDEAAGEQCRSYGAPGLMRGPTRLRLSWRDDATLQVETEYGTQTRLLHFASAPAGTPSWQGESRARWETPPAGRGDGAAAATSGTLVVRTTNLRPGYLRKNGVPYGAATTMTEYWDVVRGGSGAQRILLLIEVVDPQYLRTPWVTAVHFKKEADGAKWDPTPCSSRW